ncbi:MAG: tetratricopeptide repeat protein, partial [Rhodospirillaceae bacterium]|nr:tetratricopeptide repeat protein [Rhodospirillaceae bacterium]
GDRAEQALPLAQLAVWMRPHDAASVFLLGSILERDSRYDDAVAVFGRLQSGTIYSWEARKSAAASMAELDRHATAFAALETMAQERPNRYDALWLLGNVHRSRSAFGDAVLAYDRAIGRIPKIARRHWNLLYARGIALERSGQWPRAEADFLHALKLNPGQPYVLNYLAYSWVDRGERLVRARGMLEEAVRKRPNDGYIVDSVGWVEYRLGNFEAAVRHLERAAELRPHDPIINQHLGDAYWRARRRNEARFQWNRALWLGPEDADRKKIEERLRGGLPPFKPIARQ